MPTHEDRLVIAISSRALFDLSESHHIFTHQGTQAYHEYQVSHENEVLKPGVAFPLTKKLLALNTPTQRYVEVILMSRNSAETGLRVFNSIQHYNLDIARAAFTRGAPTSRYVAAFGAHLFLSADADDVRRVLADGYAAATIFPGAGQSDPSEESKYLRIAFDGDAVLFSDESERIYQENGLAAFAAHEQAHAHQPLPGGPFKTFLSALHRIQSSFPEEELPLRTALLTARAAPAHERVIRTLRAWNIRIDEAFFLGGLDKTEFLKMFGADIFFDDQLAHCAAAASHVPAAHVPSGVTNHHPNMTAHTAAPQQNMHSTAIPQAPQPIVDGMAPAPKVSPATAQAPHQDSQPIWLFDETHPALAPHEPTHQQLPLPTPAITTASPTSASHQPPISMPLHTPHSTPHIEAVEHYPTHIASTPIQPAAVTSLDFPSHFSLEHTEHHEIEMPSYEALNFSEPVASTEQNISSLELSLEDFAPTIPHRNTATHTTETSHTPTLRTQAATQHYAHDPLLDDPIPTEQRMPSSNNSHQIPSTPLSHSLDDDPLFSPKPQESATLHTTPLYTTPVQSTPTIREKAARSPFDDDPLLAMPSKPQQNAHSEIAYSVDEDPLFTPPKKTSNPVHTSPQGAVDNHVLGGHSAAIPQQPKAQEANLVDPFKTTTARPAEQPVENNVLSTEEILRRFARKMAEGSQQRNTTQNAQNPTHKENHPAPSQPARPSAAPAQPRADDVLTMPTIEEKFYQAPITSASPFQELTPPIATTAAPAPRKTHPSSPNDGFGSNNALDNNPFAIMKDKKN